MKKQENKMNDNGYYDGYYDGYYNRKSQFSIDKMCKEYASNYKEGQKDGHEDYLLSPIKKTTKKNYYNVVTLQRTNKNGCTEEIEFKTKNGKYVKYSCMVDPYLYFMPQPVFQQNEDEQYVIDFYKQYGFSKKS